MSPFIIVAAGAAFLVGYTVVVSLVLQRRAGPERRPLESSDQVPVHDELTKLPNRTLFSDRLERALARSVRRRARCAVLALDLDRFRRINDRLGPEVGDQVLRDVASRLDSILRPEDSVARTGGDEFMVLLETVKTTREAVAVAERVIGALSPTFQVDGRELRLAASIGIALGRGGRDRPEDVLQNAGVAARRAKDNGGGRYELFRQEMSPHPLERMGLETDLRRAVERGEFVLRYQPFVELASRQVVGVEALVHWQHPERGLIGPLEFIPVAEETGLVLPIGRRMLEEACRQAASWAQASQPLVMSVGISGRQLQQARLRLVDEVASALASARLDAGCLRLAISERAVVDDVEAAVVTMHDLKAVGVELALDHFGTGYSSLGYLRRFPLEVVKIDRSLVKETAQDREGEAVTRGLVDICHALGAKVLGEGIESPVQATLLAGVGCDLGQGSCFAPPLPPDELEQLVNPGPPLPLDVSG
jgi:diguanylate cyclase (GGDEF)-like protein